MLYYVYLIRSLRCSAATYIGCTTDLEQRLATHNSGGSSHTAELRPWEVILFMAFKDKHKAFAFEKYLKSHSGRAFAAKRFW